MAMPSLPAGSAIVLMFLTVSTPVLPVCSLDVDVTELGCVGDGRTNCTAHFRAALATIGAAGGGTLRVPADGVYLTGGLALVSDLRLVIEQNATLQAISPATVAAAAVDFPLVPCAPVACPGSSGACDGGFGNPGCTVPGLPNSKYPFPVDKARCNLQYHSLLFGERLRNVTITGGGAIDGAGPIWWRWFNWPWTWKPSKPEGERYMLNYTRPHLLHLSEVEGLVIEDVELRRSPYWTCRLTWCNDVLVQRVAVNTRDPNYCPPGTAGRCFQPANEDGIDVEGCSGVVIRDSALSTHDDSICLKAGKTPMPCGRPTENVLIQNVSVASNQGALAFGSDTSYGIRNVTARDVRISKTFSSDRADETVASGQAIHFKSMRGRGSAAVEDVLIENVDGGFADTFIALNLDYKTAPPTKPSLTPHFRNIHFRNITGFATSVAVSLSGLSDSLIENVTLTDVHINCTAHCSPLVCQDVSSFTVVRSSVNGVPLVTQNCSSAKPRPPPPPPAPPAHRDMTLRLNGSSYWWTDTQGLRSHSNVSIAVHTSDPMNWRKVLQADQPWEMSTDGSCNFEGGSTVKVGERFMLYYSIRNCSDCKATYEFEWSAVGVAFSNDGIHFEKPNLGLVPFRGTTENSIVGLINETTGKLEVCQVCRSVYFDKPTKLFRSCQENKKTGGTQCVVSDDGLSWRKEAMFALGYADTQVSHGREDSFNLLFLMPSSFLYGESLMKYTGSMKTTAPPMANSGCDSIRRN
jgi:hypothetical protein